MNDPTCIFCQIIARQAPAHILAENEQVIVDSPDPTICLAALLQLK